MNTDTPSISMNIHGYSMCSDKKNGCLKCSWYFTSACSDESDHIFFGWVRALIGRVCGYYTEKMRALAFDSTRPISWSEHAEVSWYYHFVGLLSIKKWAHNGVFIGQTFRIPPCLSQ
jgi:hypothetical protein